MLHDPKDVLAAKRRLIAFIIAAFLLGIGATFAWIYSAELRSAYRHWRQERSFAQARAFAAKNDAPSTVLALKAALEADGANPSAWRTAADFFEQAGDRQAVKLRRQVLVIEPASPANRVALINTALRFNDLVTAQQTLDEASVADRASLDFRKASAALAFAQSRPADAEALLAGILRDHPGDNRIRLDRAVIILRYAPPEVSANARAELETLADSADTRVVALRELTSAALRDAQPARALAFADRLAALPDTSFKDLLLRAAASLATGSALDDVLRPIQTRVLANPAEAIPLSTWLLATGRSRAVLAWLESLPETTRALPPLRVAHVDCLNALGEWRAASALIATGAWGPIPPEAMQLAVSARTLRERGRAKLQENAWNEAVRIASGNLASLRVLHRLALAWGWEDESRSVLFAVARTRPDQTWAHRALVRHAYHTGDTSTLKEVYRLWREAEPNNPLVEGNWAMLTLLTEPVARPTLAKTTAAKLYAASPANPFFATTHAFAVWQLGRPSEAVQIMEKLPPEERDAPVRAFYHALFLASANRPSEALRSLSLSARANLLPEERRLFIAAYEKTQPKPVRPKSAKN